MKSGYRKMSLLRNYHFTLKKNGGVIKTIRSSSVRNGSKMLKSMSQNVNRYVLYFPGKKTGEKDPKFLRYFRDALYNLMFVQYFGTIFIITFALTHHFLKECSNITYARVFLRRWNRNITVGRHMINKCNKSLSLKL